MIRIFDDLILIEYRVVVFLDKKIIAENPDVVGVVGQRNFAEQDTIRTENLELVDVRLYNPRLGEGSSNGNSRIRRYGRRAGTPLFFVNYSPKTGQAV
jgi:hypothetical protein